MAAGTPVASRTYKGETEPYPLVSTRFEPPNDRPADGARPSDAIAQALGGATDRSVVIATVAVSISPRVKLPRVRPGHDFRRGKAATVGDNKGPHNASLNAADAVSGRQLAHLVDIRGCAAFTQGQP
jgi:hypothetical protein